MIQSHGLEAAAPCQRQPTKPAQGLNMRAARELNTSFKKKTSITYRSLKGYTEIRSIHLDLTALAASQQVY